MKLFDDGVRTRMDKKSFSESNFSYLNQSALPAQERIRVLLEQWFADYPTSQYNHLRSPFRSENTRQHWGAFFELYGHALLRSQDFAVEVEPMRGMTKGKRIDFLAYIETQPFCYMESTLTLGDSSLDGSYSWLNKLCDSLDNLVSPHFRLHVQVTHIPLPSANMPSTKTMREYVRQQLVTRDPDQMLAQMQAQGLHTLPLRTFDRDGWTIKFSLRPISPARKQLPHQGTLSSVSYPTRWMDDAEIQPLWNSLEDKKPSEYGCLDLPYIIAVDAVNTMDSADVSDVLIGRGYFKQQPEVSALLMANELIPRAISRKTPLLWHNPFASHLLEQERWFGPQLVWERQSRQWTCRDGKKGWELFQLYEEWPEDERDAR